MGCSVRSGNMGAGLKGEMGDTPQVDSSPLSKSSLMSKVNQIDHTGQNTSESVVEGTTLETPIYLSISPS